jgi:hypothetical protein
MSTELPGRNDPCHCGSGKKYKHCCLSKDEGTAREKHTAETTEAEAETPAASAEAEHAHVARPSRHATRQPWKRAGVEGRSPTFNIPRRSGGS